MKKQNHTNRIGRNTGQASQSSEERHHKERKARASTAIKHLNKERIVQEKPFEGNLQDRLRRQGLETSSILHSNKSLNIHLMQNQIAPPSEMNNSINKSDVILPKQRLIAKNKKRSTSDPYQDPQSVPIPQKPKKLGLPNPTMVAKVL